MRLQLRRDDVQLLELRLFLQSVEKRGIRLGKGAQELIELLDRGRCGQGFYLEDAFDPKLAEARAGLERCQKEYDKLRGRLLQKIATELGRDIESDEFIVMRDSFKNVHGLRVIEEQPTYVLCALELDSAAADAFRNRDLAARAMSEAEDRVRAMLAGAIANRRPELQLLAEADGGGSKDAQWIR